MRFSWNKAEMTDRRTPSRVMSPTGGHFDGRPTSKCSTDILTKILRDKDPNKEKTLNRLRAVYAR